MEVYTVMHAKLLATSLFTMAALLLTTPPQWAEASPPDTQVVEYLIHEVPDHPDSPVIFGAKLTIKPMDTNGSEVAWEAIELVLMEIDSNGEAAGVWSDSSPCFATWQGLWWVEHADPENPQLSEFDMPPYIGGTALAEDQGDEDLDYALEGETCGPCRHMYGGNAGALTYDFTLIGNQVPLQLGEFEPVQIDDDDLPPLPPD